MKNHRAFMTIGQLGFAVAVCMATFGPHAVSGQQNIPTAPDSQRSIRRNSRAATAGGATAQRGDGEPRQKRRYEGL